jgi:DNA polymerase-3 subunit delta
MGELTYDQLSRRLAQGKLGGSYFLTTEDPFLRDEAIALLAEAHLAGGLPDFDLDQISGSDADPASLASLLQTPPVISSHRVIVIRGAQGLSPSCRSVVEEELQQTVTGRVLIVAAEIPRGSKAKFYETLRKKSTSLSLQTPGVSELPGWLAKRARSVHGVELEMPAAQLLAAGIGARLGVLAQELEKLATYVEPEKKIGLDQVRAGVGALPQVDRWQWIDKVVERRIALALAELPDLLDSGESAVGLIGAISEALVRVGLAREGESTLVKVLKRDRNYNFLKWKVRVYLKQSRLWTEREIENALGQLLRADRLIKSGGLADRVALEEALLRVGTGIGVGQGHAVSTGSGGKRGRQGGS